MKIETNILEMFDTESASESDAVVASELLVEFVLDVLEFDPLEEEVLLALPSAVPFPLPVPVPVPVPSPSAVALFWLVFSFSFSFSFSDSFSFSFVFVLTFSSSSWWLEPRSPSPQPITLLRLAISKSHILRPERTASHFQSGHRHGEFQFFWILCLMLTRSLSGADGRLTVRYLV